MPSLLSELIVTDPADASAASSLAGEVRAIKAFLKTWGSVAHEDNGAAKAGAAIANDSITGDMLAAGAVGSSEIAEDAVLERHLANDSVGGDQIMVGAIGKDSAGADKAHIANDGIYNSAMLKDNVVTSAKVASLNGTKLVDASVDAGTKLTAATLTADRLKHDSGWTTGDVYLPCMTSSGSVFAKIAGALAATISGSTATFALSLLSGEGMSMALIRQVVSAATSAGAWVTRKQLYVEYGTDLVAISGANLDVITFASAGTYLAFWVMNSDTSGRVCSRLEPLVAGSTSLWGNLSSGNDGESIGLGFFTVGADGAQYNFQMYSTGADANGQGLVETIGLIPAALATLFLIQIA